MRRAQGRVASAPAVMPDRRHPATAPDALAATPYPVTQLTPGRVRAVATLPDDKLAGRDHWSGAPVH
jgi:hypothetical protein